MNTPDFSDFIKYTGYLEANESRISIDFRVRINPAGEIEFEFSPIPITNTTKFITKCWNKGGLAFYHFSLFGNSQDKVSFETNDLYFTSLKSTSTPNTGLTIKPVGGCSLARFKYVPENDNCKFSTIRMQIKGFKCFSALNEECPSGIISMAGSLSEDDLDKISGNISLCADISISNTSSWKGYTSYCTSFV